MRTEETIGSLSDSQKFGSLLYVGTRQKILSSVISDMQNEVYLLHPNSEVEKQ